MNLPNRLTVGRMISIPFILLFMLPIPAAGGLFDAWNAFILEFGMLIALVLFILSSLTDVLDGRIARKQGIVTNFGKLLDPIADKLLVAGVLLAFVQLGRLHVVVVLAVLIREFVITGYRMLALEKGTVIPADGFGKLKTVLQVVAILVLFIEAVLQSFVLSDGSLWISGIICYIHWVANALIALSVLATLYSGLRYISRGMQVLR